MSGRVIVRGVFVLGDVFRGSCCPTFSFADPSELRSTSGLDVDNRHIKLLMFNYNHNVIHCYPGRTELNGVDKLYFNSHNV